MFFVVSLIFSFLVSQISYAENLFFSIDECGFYLPSPEIKFPHICSIPKISLQNTLAGKENWENLWFLDSTVYIGLHANKWLSIHAKGDYETYFGNSNPSLNLIEVPNSFPKPEPLKILYLHIGSPSTDWVQLSFGKTDTNFGINRKIIPSLLIEKLKTSSYSQRSEKGAVLLLDNQREISFEIGAFTSAKTSKNFFHPPEENDQSAVSELYGRLMIDTSILEGSRWVISYGDEQKNHRSIGVGFAVLSPEGNGGILEWQQRYEGYLFKGSGLDQIIDFQYKSEARLNSRWLFEIENYRRSYLLTSLFHEFEILSHFYLTSGISYKKPWTQESNALWIGSLGLDFKI